MRKLANIASALALSAALMMGATPAALAAPSVTYADHGVFVIADGSGYTETDLFGSMKDVMPGDVRTQTVEIRNDYGKAVDVTLVAVAHDEEGNPLTYSEAFEAADGKDQATDPEAGIGGEGQRDETVATMADFLSQLNLKVTLGSEVLFDGAPHLAGSLENPALLGRLEKGESATLNLELAVPASMGNDYMARVGEVDWVFTVAEIEPGLPETGDTVPMALLAGIAALACPCVLLGLFFLVRRRGER